MAENFNSDSDVKKDINAPDAAGTSSSPPAKAGIFAPLRIPNYRWLFSGSFATSTIQWIQSVILSWLVYDITGSGTMLGTVNLISALASVSMVFLTGLLVDYYNRKILMLLEISCVFLSTLGLGFAIVSGHFTLAYIFVYTFIFGIVQTLDSTLRQVMVFDVVPRSQTPSAIAINQTGWSIMRVAGPAIGSALLIWVGAGGSFLVQACIWVLIAITVTQIKYTFHKPEVQPPSPLQNIRVGFSFLIKERTTLIFVLFQLILSIFIIPIFSTLPAIYAVEVFGDGSGRVLGFLTAAVGAGGVLGSFVTPFLKRFEHWGYLQLGALVLVNISLIAFASSSALPVALACLALAGFFEIIFLTTNMTLMQLTIPDQLRGRVLAVINLSWILNPVGSVLAGAGSDLVGPQTVTIVFAAAAVAMVILMSLVFPNARKYKLSQGMTSK